MGTSRRHGQRFGDQIDMRIDQWVTRPQPISLSEAELDKDHQPVRTSPEPVPVYAWVRFPEAPIRTIGHALAWTDRAVLVEWLHADGRPYKAWIWGIRSGASRGPQTSLRRLMTPLQPGCQEGG